MKYFKLETECNSFYYAVLESRDSIWRTMITMSKVVEEMIKIETSPMMGFILTSEYSEISYHEFEAAQLKAFELLSNFTSDQILEHV